jgi:Ni/Fe-hydrogenase subunit HybB-like protein
MVAQLSRVMGWVILAFLLIRWVDVIYRGALGSATGGGMYAVLFFLETAMLGLAAIGLISPALREDPGAVFRMAMLIVLGGGLYRLDAALIGFMPGDGFSYFPSVLELLVTFGFAAMGVMAYLYFVKRFPILGERVPPSSPSRAGP